jgi:hypothetical protein
MTATPTAAATGNVCFAFETAVKLNPEAANSIAVERKTGSPATWMLAERPHTANELYAAIKKLHGRNAETTYEVTFRDRAGRGGCGEISMPSTLDELPASPVPGQPQAPHYPYPPHPQPAPAYAQPPQPMYQQPQPSPYPPQPPQPPTVQVAAPAVDPVAMMQETFRLFQQMHSSMQPPPQPQPAPAPAMPQMPQPSVDPMTMMQETFRLFQQMHSSMQPPPQPQPMPAPPQMPPPPPQGSDPATMIAWMQEMARLFQQMRASMVPPQPPPPPAAAQPSAQPPMGMPPMQPPPGMMYVPGFGFVPVDRLFAALSAPAPGERGPYAGPRSAFAPPGSGGGAGPGERPPYQPPQPPQPPQRAQSPIEQLREAATVLRSTLEVAHEFGLGGGAPEPAPEPEPDDDNPVRVIDMGKAKGVINRNDGSLRGFETFMANLPDIANWFGKNIAEVTKARAEARAAETQRQQQQLPPGFVVAGPGYQPPEGFVAVPVDQIPPQAQPPQPTQQPLQEPPAEMPPPLTDEQPPKPWGMPRRPGQG